MGKRYCFYCRVCDLKLTLFEDVCRNSKNKICNYYCSNCEKTTYQSKCTECNQETNSMLVIPQSITTKTDETNTIECPKCESMKTVIAFLGEWD